jgi:CRISPR/Cas system-associated protein endoribonuclease Cas2
VNFILNDNNISSNRLFGQGNIGCRIMFITKKAKRSMKLIGSKIILSRLFVNEQQYLWFIGSKTMIDN